MSKKNLNRKKIAEKIYKNLGFSKNISLSIVDDIFEALVMGIIKSDKIKISSFGTFSVVKKKERVGRNPKTGVESKIFARKIVKFTPSLKFKKEVNKK
jgi:integration host factor subunit alpha